jgi:hypothetical protein
MVDDARTMVDTFDEAMPLLPVSQTPRRDPADQVDRSAAPGCSTQAKPAVERPAVACTKLPEATPGDALFLEWNFYRREVGRLLAEGNEGRYVLIKGEEIIGIWDTHQEAKAASVQRFLMQPCLIHEIRSREPVLHGPMVFGPCRS